MKRAKGLMTELLVNEFAVINRHDWLVEKIGLHARVGS